MRMYPEPAKLLRPISLVNHPLKEVGHSFIIKRDKDRSCLLWNEKQVADHQLLRTFDQGHGPDFGLAAVTQPIELDPRRRKEPQHWFNGRWDLNHSPPLRLGIFLRRR